MRFDAEDQVLKPCCKGVAVGCRVLCTTDVDVVEQEVQVRRRSFLLSGKRSSLSDAAKESALDCL